MFTETKFSVEVEGSQIDSKDIADIVKSMNFSEKSTQLKNEDMTVKLILTESGSTIEMSKVPSKILVDSKPYELRPL